MTTFQHVAIHDQLLLEVLIDASQYLRAEEDVVPKNTTYLAQLDLRRAKAIVDAYLNAALRNDPRMGDGEVLAVLQHYF